MTVFSYRARNRQGECFEGKVEAVTRREAAQLVRQRGLWVSYLQAAAGEKLPQAQRDFSSSPSKMVQAVKNFLGTIKLIKDIRPLWQRHQKIGLETRVVFTRQLAILLQSGLPIHDALGALLLTGRKGDSYQEMLMAMRADLWSGKSLAEALARYPRAFSASFRQLVQMGEESGALDRILKDLADWLEASYRMRTELRAAMAYPLLLFAAAVTAAVFLTVFVLPSFAALLLELSAELPLPTRLLLGLSSFLQAHFPGILFVLASGLLFLHLAMRDARFRRAWDYFLWQLPFFGRLLRYGEWQVVLFMVSILLQRGIPLDRAMALSQDIPANHYLRQVLHEVTARIRAGSSLAAALTPACFLPPVLQAMLAAGEASGELDVMLARSASLARFSYEAMMRRLQVLLEPVLTLLVGGMIAFFVLSVILPLLTTMDALI